MVLGEPLPEFYKRKKRRKDSRKSKVFGGKRSLRGQILLTLLFLPFLIISPFIAIYGFSLIISANYEETLLGELNLEKLNLYLKL